MDGHLQNPVQRLAVTAEQLCTNVHVQLEQNVQEVPRKEVPVTQIHARHGNGAVGLLQPLVARHVVGEVLPTLVFVTDLPLIAVLDPTPRVKSAMSSFVHHGAVGQ